MLTTPHLHPLGNKLNECYDGQLTSLINHIDNAMYMMHFLEEESFSANEIRNVVYALKNLKEAFQEVDSTMQDGNVQISYAYFASEPVSEEDATHYQEMNLFL